MTNPDEEQPLFTKDEARAMLGEIDKASAALRSEIVKLGAAVNISVDGMRMARAALTPRVNFTEADIDKSWPNWVRHIDGGGATGPDAYIVVFRVKWWRWLTWWKVRRFRAWLDTVRPAAIWVKVKPCL